MEPDVEPRCPDCHHKIKHWFDHGAGIPFGWCGKEKCRHVPVGAMLWVGPLRKRKAAKQAKEVAGYCSCAIPHYTALDSTTPH